MSGDFEDGGWGRSVQAAGACFRPTHGSWWDLVVG